MSTSGQLTPPIVERGAFARVLKILDMFTQNEPTASAQDIARKTAIPLSSLFRLLGRLCDSGLLWHNEATGQYGPGLRAIELGDIAVRQLELPDDVSDILDGLRDATGENSSLSLWRGGSTRTCVAVSLGTQELRVFLSVGQTHPLWMGASGKAIAAFLDDAEMEQMLARAAMTAAETTKFRSQVIEIRSAGYVVTDGERVKGVLGIASPVYRRNTLFGSVTVSGPSSRLRGSADQFATAVLAAASKLSAVLGNAAVDSNSETYMSV